ncbi:Hypothetical predicted protein, partial [Mytilus galloprovincialis]
FFSELMVYNYLYFWVPGGYSWSPVIGSSFLRSENIMTECRQEYCSKGLLRLV